MMHSVNVPVPMDTFQDVDSVAHSLGESTEQVIESAIKNYIADVKDVVQKTQSAGKRTVVITVSEKTLDFLEEHGVSVEEALDHAVVCIDLEIPNKKTVQALQKSERGEGLYTVKNQDDFYASLGLDKWRKNI
jgi:antitoxin component of RelBE/YafQ-DinJ toxin-antitoxin module